MLAIEIDGIDYAGWLNATVTRSIVDLTGTFSFSFTDLYRESALPPIRAGLPCTVRRDKDLIKTGFIDSVTPSFSSDSVSFGISGRDKASDLVDCSIIGSASEFKDLSFEALVNQLASPYGISATSRVNTGDNIPSVNYDQGSTVYEVIKKHATKKHLLVYSGKDGNLIIDQAGTSQASISLVEGVNILSASGSIDASELYSNYICKGDKSASKKDGFSAEKKTAQIKGEFIDQTSPRQRPLIILQSGNLTNASALRRAKWEASARMASSESYSVTVQGWYDEINQIINFKSPTIFTTSEEAELLIAGVSLAHTPDGELTTFELVPSNAFEELPDEFITVKDKKSTSTVYLTKAQAEAL